MFSASFAYFGATKRVKITAEQSQRHFTMKEIITLQFGEYANYVGAHFWNFQVRLFPRAAIHLVV
jgi:hypothetical protein